jgi:hypothetical protein
MKNLMAAYWHRNGLEVFGMTDQKPVKYASGSLDQLEPVKRVFGKKILIVSRERCLHVRKKYPPAPEEKLYKAVALELGELFPFSKPANYCHVFQTYSTYTIVDIWAWECDDYTRIREVFPFNYVVPEDLAFGDTATTEVKIFQYGGATSMVAHADGMFLAGASYPDDQFGEEDVERFLHSLEPFGTERKRIKIYGDLPLTLKGIPELSRAARPDYPPCLDDMETLDLRTFKVKGDHGHLWEKKDFLFRIAIYLVLGYCLMLYLTLNHYDRMADQIRQKTALMDKTAVSLDKKIVKDDTPVIREANEKMNAAHPPLAVMNMLARRLPEGTSINRLALSENTVELTMLSSDPLAVLKILSEAQEINKVSLKGGITATQDGLAKTNRLGVVVELAK